MSKRTFQQRCFKQLRTFKQRAFGLRLVDQLVDLAGELVAIVAAPAIRAIDKLLPLSLRIVRPISAEDVSPINTASCSQPTYSANDVSHRLTIRTSGQITVQDNGHIT